MTQNIPTGANPVVLPPFSAWLASNIPAVYDNTMSYYDELTSLIKYLESVVLPAVNENSQSVTELARLYKELKEFVDNYFENLDVQEEINNKLDEMAEDGTLQNLIYEAIDVPQGMILNASRIGRKLFYSGSDSDAAPFNMQGGCIIDNDYIAYALWDSVNKYPVSNTIVKMNRTTGEVVNSADYSYGWCNSMTYYDGKLYIAERGKETDAELHNENNGVIKVLNANTLALVDTITMDFNVNAIYQYDGDFYILQEGSNVVYKYDNTLTTLKATITLSVSGTTYNQDICVDGKFIYLLSSQPSNIIGIFDITTGERIRTYNLNKYGSCYKIGEVQWIDKINSDYDFILGSDIITENECIANFFLINPKKNVGAIIDTTDVAKELYCDSETDYYLADGTSGKPFESLNEAINTSYHSKLIRGQNKTYKFVYASNQDLVMFNNCILGEGGYFQQGEYHFINCTFNKTIQTYSSCIFMRRSKVIFDSCTFDAGNNDYCIQDGSYCDIKFITPTFSNYTNKVFSGNLSNSVVHMNNATNVPYIPRLYNVEYPLTPTPIDAYAVDTYQWNTTLSASEIETLFANTTHVKVTYKGFSKNQDMEAYMVKNSSGTYDLCDLNLSSTSINVRICKCTFGVTKNGLSITIAAAQRDQGTGWTIIQSPSTDYVIHIKSVSLINLN